MLAMANSLMRRSPLFLFVAGLFFGGAIDHTILAILRNDVTPYGVHVGTWGNWALAVVDLGLTALFYWLYRR